MKLIAFTSPEHNYVNYDFLNAQTEGDFYLEGPANGEYMRFYTSSTSWDQAIVLVEHDEKDIPTMEEVREMVTHVLSKVDVDAYMPNYNSIVFHNDRSGGYDT